MDQTNSPQSLITQVSKESKEEKLITNSGTSSTTNGNNASATVAISVVPDSSNKTNSGEQERKSFSFFRFFCCCFYRTDRGHAVYLKDTLDLSENYLLPPLPPDLAGKKTLVLDLDETLVHSSFKPISNPDFIIPVEIEDTVHKVYVLKRPGVDQFMQRVGKHFEVVVFTASLSKYADPVLDLLDIHKVVRSRLFREACSNYKGNYVKDLSRLGRDLQNVLIIDNSPPSYLFHPENAVPIESWFDDENDTELLELLPILESLSTVENVKTHLELLRAKHGKLRTHVPNI